LLLAMRRGPSTDPSILPAQLPSASGAAQSPRASAALAPPAVAPILAVESAAPAHSAPSAHKAQPAVLSHPSSHPVPVFEKAQLKSLTGGDNPFDRRH